MKQEFLRALPFLQCLQLARGGGKGGGRGGEGDLRQERTNLGVGDEG